MTARRGSFWSEVKTHLSSGEMEMLDVFLMGLLDLLSAERKPNQTAKSLIRPLVCSNIVVPSGEFASSQSHVSNMSSFTPVKASAFSNSVFKAGSIYPKL